MCTNRNKCCCLQSPIAIETNTAIKKKIDIKLNYHNESFKISDTGQFLSFDSIDNNSSVVFNHKKFVLDQIHFHNKSENVIDDIRFDLEGHFVHYDEDDNILVISIMFKVGKPNDIIGDHFEHLGDIIEFNPEHLCHGISNFYTFIGSLTTEPFLGGVKWFVFDKTFELSQKQLRDIQSYYQNNYRELQELNNRLIFKDNLK